MQEPSAPSERLARSRAVPLAIAAVAMVMAAPREPVPGRQQAAAPVPPASERIAPPASKHVAVVEGVHDWLDQAMDTVTDDKLLYEHVQARRRSFGLFLGAANESAVRTRLRDIPYGASILEAAGRHGVDPLLVAAIAQTESRFDPEAESPRGACGLMQLMPTTARSLGASDIFDPAENLEAGVEYLAYLQRRFDDDPVLVIAGYNAGPGAVKRFRGVPPYGETRRFTNKVLRVYIAHHRAIRADSRRG